MLNPPPPPPPSNALTHLIRTTLSYDTNVMLAAIISLLLVILFVLLLHLYARWFLVQARHQSRTSVAVPHVLGSRFHHRFTIIDTTTTTTPSHGSTPKRGLPSSIVAALPLFIYKPSSEEDRKYGLECAICLSYFEEEEMGRKLPACGHAFHVECIDMWLHSHSTCPICRAPIRCDRSRNKIHDQVLEIDLELDQEPGLSGGGGGYDHEYDDDEELELEIVSIVGDVRVPENHENANVVVGDNDSAVDCSPSSSLGASLKRLLSSSNGSRCGGKIHPSVNLRDGEPEA